MIVELILKAFAFYIITNQATASFQNRITPPPKKHVYEYWLTIDSRITNGIWEKDEKMSYIYPDITNGLKYNVRAAGPNPGCNNYNEYTGNLSTLIIGDGRHREVCAINDSIPAPPIVVYSGSTVIVHVTNNMETPISLHWHGLDQRGSFFMDGVGSLSQCPISQSQTFTYKFKVHDPPGTYWYHGHTALELADGIFGPFIILDPIDTDKTTQDFVAVINDWFPYKGEYYITRARNEKFMFLYEYEDKDHCYSPLLNAAGDGVSDAPWSSAIINGRGWYNISELRSHAQILPVEEFHAESDSSKPVKLRLINAGIGFGFTFSVDEHKLTVVASDGVDMLPVKDVDYVHVTPGERYDVILKPLTKTAKRSFPVRIKNEERMDMSFTEKPEVKDRFGFGWLIYDKGPKTQYKEDNRQCTKSSPCQVVNCPWEKYPSGSNKMCINLEKLRAKMLDGDDDDVLRPSIDRFQQYFINMGEPTEYENINKIKFVSPSSPPFMHPGREADAITPCDPECGRTRECACTYGKNLALGNTIELVIVDQAQQPIANKFGIGHPWHVHGHHFYVVRQGWPVYKESGGLFKRVSDDIVCNGFDCSFNDKNGNATLLAKKSDGKPVPFQYTFEDGYKPVVKDTVYVPHGGYLITRFKANNPGWWLAHCHILIHHAKGMVMYFKEGNSDDMPEPPHNFPTCGVSYGRLRR